MKLYVERCCRSVCLTQSVRYDLFVTVCFYPSRLANSVRRATLYLFVIYYMLTISSRLLSSCITNIHYDIYVMGAIDFDFFT